MRGIEIRMNFDENILIQENILFVQQNSSEVKKIILNSSKYAKSNYELQIHHISIK